MSFMIQGVDPCPQGKAFPAILDAEAKPSLSLMRFTPYARTDDERRA
jgi:hypothetical protein